jgi:hypothetical protein
MSVIQVQDEFQSGDNVTASSLNDLVNDASFTSGAVDNSTMQVASAGHLKVKDNGILSNHLKSDATNDLVRAVTTNHIRNDAVTNAKIANLAVGTDQIAADAVTYAKMQNVAALSVIGNNTNSPANPTSIAIDDLKNNISNATTSVSGLMSDTDKTKLDGIEEGAEVNVQSDWNASSGDALILNKPTIPTVPGDATTSASGLMSASDKTKLNGLSNFSLDVADASTLGGVKEGGDIDIDANGVMTVSSTATSALQGVGGWTFVSHTNIYSKSDSSTVHDEEIQIFGRSSPSIPSNARYAMLAHEMNQGYCEVWTHGVGNKSINDSTEGFVRYGGGNNLDGASIVIVENLQLPKVAFEWATNSSGGTPGSMRTGGKYPTSTTHSNLIPAGYVRMKFGGFGSSAHNLYILGYAY